MNRVGFVMGEWRLRQTIRAFVNWIILVPNPVEIT